jgi:hypothetical protein
MRLYYNHTPANPRLKLIYKARPLGRLAAIFGREYVAHQFRMLLSAAPGRIPLTNMQLLAIFTAGEGNHNFVRLLHCSSSLEISRADRVAARTLNDYWIILVTMQH